MRVESVMAAGDPNQPPSVLFQRFDKLSGFHKPFCSLLRCKSMIHWRATTRFIKRLPIPRRPSPGGHHRHPLCHCKRHDDRLPGPRHQRHGVLLRRRGPQSRGRERGGRSAVGSRYAPGFGVRDLGFSVVARGQVYSATRVITTPVMAASTVHINRRRPLSVRFRLLRQEYPFPGRIRPGRPSPPSGR